MKKILARLVGFAVALGLYYGIAYMILMALGPAYHRPYMLHILAWLGAVAFGSGDWINGALHSRIVRSYWKAQGYTAEASQRKLEELEEHARGGSWVKHGGRE